MKDCILCGATVYHFGGESLCPPCREAAGRKCLSCGLKFIEKGILRKDLLPLPEPAATDLLGLPSFGEHFICPPCKEELESMKEY